MASFNTVFKNLKRYFQIWLDKFVTIKFLCLFIPALTYSPLLLCSCKYHLETAAIVSVYTTTITCPNDLPFNPLVVNPFVDMLLLIICLISNIISLCSVYINIDEKRKHNLNLKNRTKIRYAKSFALICAGDFVVHALWSGYDVRYCIVLKFFTFRKNIVLK